MNSHVHLLREDRPEYERLLDDVLLAARERPELRAVGERLDTDELRTMALAATGLITSTAAAEYAHYVKVREEHRDQASRSAASAAAPSSGRRRSAPAFPRSGAGAAERRSAAPGPGHRFGAAVLGAGGRGVGVSPLRWAGMSFRRRLLAALLGLHVRPEEPKTPKTPKTTETRTPPASERRAVGRTPHAARPAGRGTPDPEAAGAGLLAVAAVLVPVLSGAAALVFLLIGYVLTLLDPRSSFAGALTGAGWWFAALAGAGVLFAAAGLVVTALRAGRPPADDDEEEAEEEAEDLEDDVSRAREAWRNALLERGIVPFLHTALDPPDTGPARHMTYRSSDRLPNLGYTRPNFASAGLTSPDFTSPDFADTTDGSRPASPGPDFTTPDFGGSEPRSE
ncbi:hypothetical protein [Streptomyces showdoensis]|uniref:hypothetical protein n=1 Tax=Streptomyces showdoensis TaxID=68268 RepID=UPI001969F44D